MREIEPLLEQAQRHVDERRWEPAAMLYTRAAQQAQAGGEGELARRIWDLAGETWRREDHPAAAARALRSALTLSAGEAQAVAAVKLSAVLGELGRVEEAVRWARQGMVGPVAPIARDSLCGHLLALGKVDEARRWLPPLVDGPMGSAHWFRVAQIARLDGDFEQAVAALDEALARLEGVPGAESGRGAARGERVEIYLLTDEPEPAIALAEAAVDEHRAAGRRSMAWRAEASRVRALVAAGIAAPSTLLDEGIGFANVRELPLLAADLLLARAELRPGDTDDLARAVELGESSWIRRGRARLMLADRRGDRELAERAREDLAPSRPWSARADALLARLD
ncbi:MAG: hypothetical protein EP330_04270 [Deltaproteobacteria bacterium]|nr:MAG: hypothetical protein EP330_04270 [Deltaproteobacteria bacterium]